MNKSTQTQQKQKQKKNGICNMNYNRLPAVNNSRNTMFYYAGITQQTITAVGCVCE